MRFVVTRHQKNDGCRSDEPKEKFVSRPRAIKGKTSSDGNVRMFLRVSERECSACPIGLLTGIIRPCLLHLSVSRCQLVPSAPSSLVHAAAARPIAAESTAIITATCRMCPECPVLDVSALLPPSPPPSSCRHSRTAPAAAASKYRLLRLVFQVRALPVAVTLYAIASALLPFAAYASAAAVARSTCPSYPILDTLYAAAAAPIAIKAAQPCSHQTLSHLHPPGN
jgi:hypothetical protein